MDSTERTKTVQEVQDEIRRVIFEHWNSTGINLSEDEYDRLTDKIVNVMFNPPLLVEVEIESCFLGVNFDHLEPSACQELWVQRKLIVKKLYSFWRDHFCEDIEKEEAIREVQKEVRRIVWENWDPVNCCLGVPPDEYDNYADMIVCIMFESPDVDESKIRECLRNVIREYMTWIEEPCPELEKQTERVTKILGFFWWRLLDKDSERARAVQEIQNEVRRVIFDHWNPTGINLPENEYDRYASRIVGIMYNPPLLVEREIHECLRNILETDIGWYLYQAPWNNDEALWKQLKNQLWHPLTLIAKELISFWWRHFGEHDEKARTIREVQKEVRRVIFEHWTSTGINLSEDVYDMYTNSIVSIMFNSPVLVEEEICDCINNNLQANILMYDDKGESYWLEPEECEGLDSQSPLIAKKLVAFWRSHFGKE